MRKLDHLADSSHPKIREIAFQLTESAESDEEKVKSLFYFVRDEIRFGFPSRLEDMKASEVVSEKVGVCNSKTTLFKALLDVAGIPSRIHYGAIDLHVFRGVIPGYMRWVLPKTANHSWLEISIDGGWKPMDSYIFDKPYFRGARKKLIEEGQHWGYGLACPDGACSCAFHFGNKGFVQMKAVLKDFGAWNDDIEFFGSGFYEPVDERFRSLYPKMAALVNKRIRQIRIESLKEEEASLPSTPYLDQLLLR
ncbi:MAG: transglutaminase domain-containing protein [Saprospirales bacterium]|nr:transglutaminase domain-containing protein [Saprospirales bacterium]